MTDPTGPAEPAVPYRPPKLLGRKVARHSVVLQDMARAVMDNLMHETLDPGYAAAASAKAGQPAARRRMAPLALTVVGLLVAGLIVGVAYSTRARAAPATAKARDALIAQIGQHRAAVAALSDQQQTLDAQVTKLRDSLLGSSTSGKALLDQVAGLQAATAQTAVKGPGIVVTIADSKPKQGGDPVGGVAPDITQLITDRDLQRVVNDLFAGGATAIAINGKRIGPTTAIRQAGGAILVDFLPVTSPYAVQAIGDANALQTAFAGSPTGRRLFTYKNVYGAGLGIEPASELNLPPAISHQSGVAVAIGGTK